MNQATDSTRMALMGVTGETRPCRGCPDVIARSEVGRVQEVHLLPRVLGKPLATVHSECRSSDQRIFLARAFLNHPQVALLVAFQVRRLARSVGSSCSVICGFIVPNTSTTISEHG